MSLLKNKVTEAAAIRYFYSHIEQIEQLDVDAFTNTDIIYIFKCMQDIYKSNRYAATQDDIYLRASTDGKDADFYKEFYIQLITSPYTKYSENSIRNAVMCASMKQGFGEAIDVLLGIESKSGDANYDVCKDIDRIKDIINAASSYNIAKGSVPMSFWNINDHNVDHNDYLKAPWGIHDKGYEIGTLSVYLGPSNAGKSIFLCNEAVNHMMNGEDVLFITLEMSSQNIIKRCSQCMFNITESQYYELIDNNKAGLITKMKEAKENQFGEMIVRYLPSGSTSAKDIKNIIDSCTQIHPRVVIVDYLGLMTSSKYNAKGDLYTSLKNISEELRALAVNEQIVIITACQTNRNGFKDQKVGNITLGDIAESAGIVHTSDNIFGINPYIDPSTKVPYFVLGILKVRDSSNKDSEVNLLIDYSAMRITRAPNQPNEINTVNPIDKIVEDSEKLPAFDSAFDTDDVIFEKEEGTEEFLNKFLGDK